MIEFNGRLHHTLFCREISIIQRTVNNWTKSCQKKTLFPMPIPMKHCKRCIGSFPTIFNICLICTNIIEVKCIISKYIINSFIFYNLVNLIISLSMIHDIVGLLLERLNHSFLKISFWYSLGGSLNYGLCLCIFGID